MKNTGISYGIYGILILILMSGVVVAQTYTTPSSTALILNYDLMSVDKNLKPGSTGVLMIPIQNNGLDAREVEAWLSDTQYISTKGYWELGTIIYGGTTYIATTIKVAEDADIGSHIISLRLKYKAERQEELYDLVYGKFVQVGIRSETTTEETNWEIPITVYGYANFQIDSGSGVFQKDTLGDLILKGTTNGGANDISITLSSDCVSVIGSAKKYIGDLNPNEDFTLNYKINPDQAGTCPISISLDYDDLAGNPITEVISAGIQVKRYDVDFAIIDVNYTLSPGNVSDVGITLKNIGTTQASDVSVHLTLADPFKPTKTSESYIGMFDGEETKDISFGISVGSEAKLKTYEIPFTIEYFDPSGSKHTVEKTLGLQVGGAPELEIAIDTDESDLFREGITGKVTISIVNKGFVDAKFLSMRLLTSEDYEILSTEKIYVGDASSDDVESVEYKIRVNKDSTGTVPLNLALEYRDDNNNQYTKDMALNLNILSAGEYSQQMGGNGALSSILMYLGIIIGLFVALIAIWFVYKSFIVVTGFLNERIFAKR